MTFEGEATMTTVEDTVKLLTESQSVIIVPGYGLAVAHGQYPLKEMVDTLVKNGKKVRFAIHPVAGRLPGHMNVLMAEANVPYDIVLEMDEINPTMAQVDVAIVLGANDVVNPVARSNPESPIYGMPILKVWDAKHVIVLKRSMRPGYAGIQNQLFFHGNTRRMFGDAKDSISKLVSEVKTL